MSGFKRYPPEVKERAVQMFVDHRNEYPTEWQAMTSIATKFGMVPETLRSWVRQAEIDNGQRDGVTTDDAQRIKELERENRELRRANEILKSAASFLRGGARPPLDSVITYIDTHKDVHGVEPICRVLQVAPSTYYAAKTRPPSARSVRDEELKAHI